ncbi:ATP/GTP-binding protein [Akanthomyces lecanii RCEF 1005]|uniref:ATP/GTP-binding protein n=1 Tax=Akanthomyces lecanii RCEF 1005 TaxID=1081108 RepID=A0A168GNJ4_CORDF|nr:ATP/GTP-binding protein [Akanthomyces lecanii RCEF 1005]
MASTSVPPTGPAPIESPAFEEIRPRLARTTGDPRPVVLMTCAIAGAGKSTLAKTITAKLPSFVRFSADKLVRDRYGLYGIDFARDKHAGYLEEAQAHIKTDLAALIKNGANDAVLDLSFYNKEYRDEYKAIIEDAGGRWVLVFLDAEKDLLWRRIQGRRAARDRIPVESGARDGDSAYDIEPETFEMYCSGFEPPVGEGEIRVLVV